MKLRTAVINRSNLENQPSVPIRGTDLAEVVLMDEGRQTHMMTNDDLARMRLSDEESIEMAEAASGKEVYTTKTLAETLGIDLQDARYDKEFSADAVATFDPSNGIYVLTNAEGQLGASVLMRLDVLRDLHRKIGDYYILPSSIHEVLALSVKWAPDVKDLEDTVRQVNRTEVLPEERLSDNVYYFDGKSLSMARDHVETAEAGIEKMKSEGMVLS